MDDNIQITGNPENLEEAIDSCNNFFLMWLLHIQQHWYTKNKNAHETN